MASTLNQRQLLKISADIAHGMVHLSSQKVCDVFINFCQTKPIIEYCKFIANSWLNGCQEEYFECGVSNLPKFCDQSCVINT